MIARTCPGATGFPRRKSRALILLLPSSWMSRSSTAPSRLRPEPTLVSAQDTPGGPFSRRCRMHERPSMCARLPASQKACAAGHGFIARMRRSISTASPVHSMSPVRGRVVRRRSLAFSSSACAARRRRTTTGASQALRRRAGRVDREANRPFHAAGSSFPSSSKCRRCRAPRGHVNPVMPVTRSPASIAAGSRGPAQRGRSEACRLRQASSGAWSTAPAGSVRRPCATITSARNATTSATDSSARSFTVAAPARRTDGEPLDRRRLQLLFAPDRLSGCVTAATTSYSASRAASKTWRADLTLAHENDAHPRLAATVDRTHDVLQHLHRRCVASMSAHAFRPVYSSTGLDSAS